LEGDWKGLSLWEHKKYVEWVQDLLWNCNKLILSRREMIPKSVVPSCLPSVFNSLDGCQDMHNLKEVLVTRRAKSKDSSERNKKSFADVPPGGGEGSERRFGNSGGNEDVINITKRQQVKLTSPAPQSPCEADILPPMKVIPPKLFLLLQFLLMTGNVNVLDGEPLSIWSLTLAKS